MTSNPQARWKSEAEFFDQVAAHERIKLRPVSPAVLQRYTTKRRRIFAPEYRFRVAGDVRGKRILDVGCGDGGRSSLLALLGAAHVDGIDISPRAIELSHARADLNGVTNRTRFICAPLETVELPDSAYDVIWCDAILHHLITDLDATLERFRRWIAPNGRVVMVEPVNLSPALRRLRFAVAADSQHTEDERPLEQIELATVARHFPELKVRLYHGLGRLNRYILPDSQYETAAWWRKVATHAVGLADWWLLSIPVLNRVGGVAVLSAHVRK